MVRLFAPASPGTGRISGSRDEMDVSGGLRAEKCPLPGCRAARQAGPVAASVQPPSAGAVLSNWQVFQCLCQIIAGHEVAVAAERVSAAGSWSTLYAYAREQKCTSTLAARLDRSHGAMALVPEQPGRALREMYRMTIVRNLGIYSQAVKLARILNRGGIEPLFFKGTAILLTGDPANIGCREQQDIDLLVAPGDVEGACSLLLEGGYSFTAHGRRVRSHRDYALALKDSRYHHHLPPLIHAEGGVSVELHRHHLAREFQREEELAKLLGTSLPQQVRGARFRVPSAEQGIVLCVLGNFLHDGYAGRYAFPLRAAFDILQILRRQPTGSAPLDLESAAGRWMPEFIQFWGLFGPLLQVRWSPGGLATGTRRLRLLQARYDSLLLGRLLDFQGRCRSVATQLRHNPGKLLAFLERIRD
jgi:hypothetical protein